MQKTSCKSYDNFERHLLLSQLCSIISLNYFLELCCVMIEAAFLNALLYNIAFDTFFPVFNVFLGNPDQLKDVRVLRN